MHYAIKVLTISGNFVANGLMHCSAMYPPWLSLPTERSRQNGLSVVPISHL